MTCWRRAETKGQERARNGRLLASVRMTRSSAMREGRRGRSEQRRKKGERI